MTTTKQDRPHRMAVRLTEAQHQAVLQEAAANYRTPQAQVQMLLDAAVQALGATKPLADAYASARNGQEPADG